MSLPSRSPRRSFAVPARRAVAAVALCAVVGLAACGDDDDGGGDDPVEQESPPTGANLSDEGTEDVNSSIADPRVVASNVGDNLDGQAPFNT